MKRRKPSMEWLVRAAEAEEGQFISAGTARKNNSRSVQIHEYFSAQPAYLQEIMTRIARIEAGTEKMIPFKDINLKDVLSCSA